MRLDKLAYLGLAFFVFVVIITLIVLGTYGSNIIKDTNFLMFLQWYIFLFVFNLVNIFITLILHYKMADLPGVRGLKGYTGEKGKSGENEKCFCDKDYSFSILDNFVGKINSLDLDLKGIKTRDVLNEEEERIGSTLYHGDNDEVYNFKDKKGKSIIDATSSLLAAADAAEIARKLEIANCEVAKKELKKLNIPNYTQAYGSNDVHITAGDNKVFDITTNLLEINKDVLIALIIRTSGSPPMAGQPSQTAILSQLYYTGLYNNPGALMAHIASYDSNKIVVGIKNWGAGKFTGVIKFRIKLIQHSNSITFKKKDLDIASIPPGEIRAKIFNLKTGVDDMVLLSQISYNGKYNVNGAVVAYIVRVETNRITVGFKNWGSGTFEGKVELRFIRIPPTDTADLTLYTKEVDDLSISRDQLDDIIISDMSVPKNHMPVLTQIFHEGNYNDPGALIPHIASYDSNKIVVGIKNWGEGTFYGKVKFKIKCI